MNYLIVGGASFIGTNLALNLFNKKEHVTSVDRDRNFFNKNVTEKVDVVIDSLSSDSDFVSMTKNQDIVFHLISFSKSVSESVDSERELKESITFTKRLLDACRINHVKKVIFISSGGTVYGKVETLPINENHPLTPISAYGTEKVSDEECFKDYNGEYHIFRLANPYGPYQRIDGAVGAVTKFLHKALNNETITIVGDGSVIRDYIFIDDVINAMLNVVNSDNKTRIYNIGSGIGVSINELLSTIKKITGESLIIEYKEGRKGDVPINYLDVGLYEKEFGKLAVTSLEDGIKKIIDFYR